jgi:hypothetical protein
MNRKLATASIDKYGECDSRGATEVSELVERRSHGSAGVEYVVDDQHTLAVEVPRQLRRSNDRAGPDGLEIVAIERNVERTTGNLHLLAVIENVGEAITELHASPLNPHENQVVGSIEELDDPSAIRRRYVRARDRARSWAWRP